MGQKQKFAYIGSRAEPNTPGIYVCAYDADTGELTLTGSVDGLKNPTYLDIDDTAHRLYTIAQGVDADGESCGEAVAYTIDRVSGQLTLLNRERTVTEPTCHIILDRTRRTLMVSSYQAGLVGLSPIGEDGRVSPLADMHQHYGSSILPNQSKPRAHSMSIDRLNRFALACDLGADRIFIYQLDVEGNKLVPHNEISVAPGSGPRHWAFHPSHAYGYAINELNATITVFAYDEQQGELTTLQTVPTLPEDYVGGNSCADIHISQDGRYLYGSNRGHDSIVVYAIDPNNGHLSFIEHASVLGQHPRAFAISPDGRFLIIANRDTDNIVTLSRDADSGKLTPTGHELQIAKPVCVKFLKTE